MLKQFEGFVMYRLPGHLLVSALTLWQIPLTGTEREKVTRLCVC